MTIRYGGNHGSCLAEAGSGLIAPRSLLVVDGDDMRRRALAEQLSLMDGVEVETASDGPAATQLLDNRGFDLLLIDMDLADGGGLDLARSLRAQGMRLPIILVAAAGTENAATGEDVVERPFKLNLLLARIEAHLRRRDEAPFELTIGPYRFSPLDKLLIDETAERTVRLTEKEAEILQYLARAGDRTTGRELLLHEVWGYNSEVTTHTLETHVYRLRQKIEADPARALILVSEPGGYRLIS